jgi:hypothetical protein
MWRIVIVLVIVGLCVHTAAALDGSGTQQDPFRIDSLADFDEFATYPIYWAFHTRLETDVNLAGRTYSTAVIAPDTNNAISWQFDGTAFTGVFDGNDHKIVNLTIDGGAGNWFLGLFGLIDEGEVKNLRLEGGSVSGFYFVGRLVGANGYRDYPGGAIANCYSTGDVNGYGWVGGLVGVNYGTVSNCYSSGDVNGVVVVGGLVGFNYDRVSNCYSTGDVSGGEGVGGLVGCNYDSVSNCYSTGNVSGGEGIGGLVGCIGSLRSTGIVSNCYSTGSVSGDDYVGGLVGENYNGSVLNCYSIGDANGINYVGGLVGSNGGAWFELLIPGYVYNSYSTDSVQGASSVGGLVGYNECGDIKKSFWDVQTSGEPNMCGYQDEEYATGCDPNCGKTTAEMKTRSTFTDAGWDFVEIWGIGEHQTYPYLRFAPAGDFNYDKKVDLLDLAIFADHWLEGITP